MTIRFHADDFGITAAQARAILDLSSACGGTGALTSVSIFANSPAFEQAAALALPHVNAGNLQVAVHINLVEGRPVSNPRDVPLLVGERQTFANNFLGLMKLMHGSARAEAARQIKTECAAQIERFLGAFPAERGKLNLDSHQHTHMIPLVFDALMAAARDCGCTVGRLRVPVEDLAAHRGIAGAGRAFSVNNAKNVLLGHYAKRDLAHIPPACKVDAFSGVLLSGHMQDASDELLDALEQAATQQGRALEVLFHPVSMEPKDCLDPENEPFTRACCSSARDAEAARLRELAGR